MHTILLIEDNTDIRETTATILELAGYKVIAAENGKLGVEAAQREKPDLIICDIMMPVLDGYGVLHLLSKNPELALIPFIFLSAKAEKTDFRKGMGMGADDYITKPFEDIDLLHAIETRLKKSETARKEFEPSIGGPNEFFSDVSAFDDLEQLSESNARLHKKKDTLYTEGTYPRGVYFVNKGKVKTFKTNEQGKELITGLYGDGEFFGYLSILEECAYRDSAMTMEDTEICMIPKDDFFALIYQNHQISRKFIKMLSNNLQEKEDRLIKLAYNSVRKRVADALIKLGGEGTAGTSISREDLANLAGTATETTIRTLSDFRQEGLIDIQSGKIQILRHDQLATLKN